MTDLELLKSIIRVSLNWSKGNIIDDTLILKLSEEIAELYEGKLKLRGSV
jgi:hypothetical protein